VKLWCAICRAVQISLLIAHPRHHSNAATVFLSSPGGIPARYACSLIYQLIRSPDPGSDIEVANRHHSPYPESSLASWFHECDWKSRRMLTVHSTDVNNGGITYKILLNKRFSDLRRKDLSQFKSTWKIDCWEVTTAKYGFSVFSVAHVSLSDGRGCVENHQSSKVISVGKSWRSMYVSLDEKILHFVSSSWWLACWSCNSRMLYKNHAQSIDFKPNAVQRIQNVILDEPKHKQNSLVPLPNQHEKTQKSYCAYSKHVFPNCAKHLALFNVLSVW
jgi:hypothetical protein